MEKVWDIFGKNYGIYSAKTIRYFKVYIRKKYGIHGSKLWDILWDILFKNCWIYLAKLWHKRSIECIKQKLRVYIRQNYGIYRANIMGYTMGYICQKLWDIFYIN